MTNAHNRLTKYGIAGLAGIAILGWVREPERQLGPTVKLERATFQFQALPAPEAIVPFQVATTTRPARKVAQPATRYRSSAERTLPPVTGAPAESGRHELPQARSEATAEASTPELQADVAAARTPAPLVRGKQKRTASQTAMIIGGAAAAGAAIGGIAGGGKGAAIGAVTAGAGGYLYDRMTRNRGALSGSGRSTRDRDDGSDPFTSRFATRIGTPGFAR